MQISGFQPTTLLDYPDHIACIVFTLGCNFRCPFCHNPEFVLPEKCKDQPIIDQQKIFDFLEKRKGKLEAVVITGGEPTIHADLPDFIRQIKKLNYKVKLDTNGTDPSTLENLYNENLLDYTAMDIKSPLSKYETVTSYTHPENITKSIQLIMQSGIPYEFRSTILPRLHTEEDIEQMAKMIHSAEKYYLQNFRPDRTLDPAYSKERPFTDTELQTLKTIASKHVKHCEIRT